MRGQTITASLETGPRSLVARAAPDRATRPRGAEHGITCHRCAAVEARTIALAAGADAQLAKDAAVEIQDHLGVRSIDGPVGIELREIRREHLEFDARPGRPQAVGRQYM